MKLYHFTSRIHLPYIMREGITKGRIPWMIDKRTGRVGLLRGNPRDPDDVYQWLTESDDWNQDWDLGTCPPLPPYTRTYTRIAVDFSGMELRRLFRLSDFLKVNQPESAPFLTSFASSRHWYLYHGRIFPRQFIGFDQDPTRRERPPAQQ